VHQSAPLYVDRIRTLHLYDPTLLLNVSPDIQATNYRTMPKERRLTVLKTNKPIFTDSRTLSKNGAYRGVINMTFMIRKHLIMSSKFFYRYTI